MTKLIAIAALFCLAAPAALAAPPAGQGPSGSSTPNPSQLCAAQLHTMGPANFASLYAPTGNGKNAFGKCVSRQAQVADTSADNAAKTCKLERGTTTATIDAFNLKYGTNKNKKNAFGKCVSGLAADSVDAQQDATMNAAKKCKAERGTTAATIEPFTAKYGTNKNKRNAFGKCVSKLAKQQGSSS